MITPRCPTTVGLVAEVEQAKRPGHLQLILDPAVSTGALDQTGQSLSRDRAIVTVEPDALNKAEDGTLWTGGGDFDRYALTLSPPTVRSTVYPWPLELWVDSVAGKWEGRVFPDSPLTFSITPTGPVRDLSATARLSVTVAHQGLEVILRGSEPCLLKPGEKMSLGGWDLRAAVTGVGGVHACVRHIVQKFPMFGIVRQAPRVAF